MYMQPYILLFAYLYRLQEDSCLLHEEKIFFEVTEAEFPTV